MKAVNFLLAAALFVGSFALPQMALAQQSSVPWLELLNQQEQEGCGPPKDGGGVGRLFKEQCQPDN
jgi:hypothetical protein